MPAPTCVWVDSQTEPFEGRGKTKRTSDSVDDIESNPERPEILDESCRRRHELSPPLTNLSTTERKHNSTSCALWSLPRIFLFCAPVGGGGAHKSVCFLHADACPTHPDLPASVCLCACIPVVLFPRMLGVPRSAPQRTSGASSGKRETTSAPLWAAPRNARRQGAGARGPSRALLPTYMVQYLVSAMIGPCACPHVRLG